MDGGTFSNTGSIISQLAEELIQGGQVGVKGGCGGGEEGTADTGRA
jgi:hypothetical protein